MYIEWFKNFSDVWHLQYLDFSFCRARKFFFLLVFVYCIRWPIIFLANSSRDKFYQILFRFIWIYLNCSLLLLTKKSKHIFWDNVRTKANSIHIFLTTKLTQNAWNSILFLLQFVTVMTLKVKLLIWRLSDLEILLHFLVKIQPWLFLSREMLLSCIYILTVLTLFSFGIDI